MYQIKVNGYQTFAIETKRGELLVDGKTVTVDQVAIDASRTHILYQNRSYTTEIVELNVKEKMAVVKVNGTTYSLAISDQFDQLLKQLGMDNLSASKILQVKAPMPGLVLTVLVSAEQEVKKGDNLLVLEAMKMENMIKSPTDGIIRKINVLKGDKVEKNELLISFA